MFKKTIKSATMFFLVAALLLGLVPTNYLYATEVTDVPEATEEGIQDGSQEFDPIDAPVDDTTDQSTAPYSMKVNYSKLSFGTITKNEIPKSQDIIITNTGSNTINLAWNETDPDNAFVIDYKGNYKVDPGKKASFAVVPKDSLTSGTYKAVFLFGEDTDIAFQYGVKVEVSVTVTAAVTTVTAVNIAPKNATVVQDGTQTFRAEVVGENDPSQKVTYAVSGAKSGATKIDENGLLKVGSDETATTLTVTATSEADTSISDTATVSVQASEKEKEKDEPKDDPETKNYSVNVSASPMKAGVVTGGGVVKDGDSITIDAAAKNGYTFVGWVSNGKTISKSQHYSIVDIHSNLDVVAKFERSTVRVYGEVNHDYQGTVKGAGSVKVGESISLEATPNAGYKFVCWTEKGKNISNDSRITLSNVTSDRHIMACFTKSTYYVKLGIDRVNSGTVEGQKEYDGGSSVTIKATPAKGYSFVGWSENNVLVSKEPVYKIDNIQADHSYTAHFVTDGEMTYKCSSWTTSTDGVISPAGDLNIPKGKAVTYTITPKKGYRIKAVAIDGKLVNNVTTTYTFKDVTAEHTIVAAFEAIPKTDSKPKTKTTTSIYSENDRDANEIELTENVKEGDIGKSESVVSENIDSYAGVLQEFNMSADEAKAMLQNRNASLLIDTAIEKELLEISVYNEFSANNRESVDGPLAVEDPTMLNFGSVVDSIFTAEELLTAFAGNHIFFYLDIGDDDPYLTNEDKAEFAGSLTDKAVAKYFYVELFKEVNNNEVQVTELNTPMSFKLKVPDDVKALGKDLQIARWHEKEDGTTELTFLQNESTDPDYVVFTTDKFSDYALVYDSVGGAGAGIAATTEASSMNVKAIIIGVLVALAAALTAITVFAFKKIDKE